MQVRAPSSVGWELDGWVEVCQQQWQICQQLVVELFLGPWTQRSA